MYLIKDRNTNKELVLCRTEIALESAMQTYEASGRKVIVEWTDRVVVNTSMEQ